MGIDLLNCPPDTRTRWQRWRPTITLVAGMAPLVGLVSLDHVVEPPPIAGAVIAGWTLIFIGWVFRRRRNF